MTFSEHHMKCFETFERIRKTGEFNMLTRQAMYATELSQEDHLFVVQNYRDLAKQHHEQQEDKHIVELGKYYDPYPI